MKLRDEIAIVTGATSGLGAAIARKFGAEGAKVAVVGRNAERGAGVAAQISASGGAAAFFAADVTVEADVRAMLASVVAQLGKPTILVNNAGLVIPGDVISLTAEQWDAVFRINVSSAYLVSHYTIPHMLERGRGSVIHMSSEAGLKGLKGRAAYCAAKAALVGLTKAMAVDHSGQGVRVNCICPGTIETPMVQQLIASNPDPAALREQFVQRRLTPFLGSPDDVAEAALYFASPDNRYVTGAILSVDGGALAK